MGIISALAGATLDIIPNPTKGEFIIRGTINTGNDKHVILEITDLPGQVVYKGESAVQNRTVDKQIMLGNTLANGMYLLNVRSDSENKVFHIVLER